jgi:predicted ATPase
MNAFQKIKQFNGFEIVFVKGFAGVGKSSLISEIRRPVMTEHCFFLFGKFDQYHSFNDAYGAFSITFRDLVKQIISEGEKQVKFWRTEFLEVLGCNGKLIIDFIPELESIIGPQNPVAPTISHTEAKNRFNQTVQSFINAIVRNRPTVLIIDDLQWATPSSLNLLQCILETPDLKNFLFIGSYRENEVSSNHPLILTIEEIQKNCVVPISYIELKPLSFHDSACLISDTMHRSMDSVKPLTQYIWNRCEGNPLCVKQMLRSLYNEQAIFYSSPRNMWEYDLSKEIFPTSESIIEHMVYLIDRLPESKKQLLKQASCLGNSFSSAKFQLITGTEKEELLMELSSLINSGFLVLVGDVIHFAHDRIQETVYNQFSEDQKQETHLNIAKKLLEYYRKKKPYELEEYVIELVDHFNRGKELKDTEEIIELAEFNLMAGRKCKKAVAFTAAISYLQKAIDCFKRLSSNEDECWKQYHELGFSLYKEIIDAFYCVNQRTESERYIELVLSRANSAFEKGQIYTICIIQNSSDGRMMESINYARTALEIFDIHLPIDEQEILKLLVVEQELVQNELNESLMRGNGNINMIIESLPIMTDPEKILVSQIISVLIVPAILSFPTLFALVSIIGVRYSLKFGWSAYSPTSLMFFASMLVSGPIQPEKIKIAHILSRISIELCEKIASNDLAQKSSIYHVYACQVAPWFSSFRETEVYSNLSFKLGLQSGNIQYAAFSRYILLQMFFRGDPIDMILIMLNNSTKFLEKANVYVATYAGYLLRLTTYHLLGKKHEQSEKDLEDEEMKVVAQLKQKNDLFLLGHYATLKCIRWFIYDQDIQEALDFSSSSQEYVPHMPSLVTTVILRFYHCLIICRYLAHNESIDIEKKKIWKQTVVETIDSLRILSEHSPAIFKHKLLLLEAAMNHSEKE